MKMNKLMVAALLLGGVTFASCSNDEGGAPSEQKGTQSMVVKLSGLSQAKDGKMTAEATQTGAKTASLSDVKILFAADETVVRTEDVSSTDDDWTNLTGAQGNGVIYHELPATVNKVIVVGNAASQTLDVTSVSKLKASVVSLANQQDFSKVILLGADETLDEVEPNTDTDHPEGTLKKAEMTISPVVSRLEIRNIQCLNKEGKAEAWQVYQSLKLKNIGLMNFNDQLTLNGANWTSAAAGTTYTLANVKEPGQTGDIVFCGTGYPAWAGYTWSANNTLNSGTDVLFKYEAQGQSNENPLCLQFVPTAGDEAMQLKLYLEGTKLASQGGGVDAFNNTVTANLGSLQTGKIYTVDYKFQEDNIKPWDPSQVACIQVDVTVADWTVEALTPTFE